MDKLRLVAKITNNQKIVGYRLEIGPEQYRDVNVNGACKIADLGYIIGVKSNQSTGRLVQSDGQVDLRRLKQIPINEIRRQGDTDNGEMPDCVKKALEKYNQSKFLVKTIEQGYSRYGVLESLDVGLRQFWGRCEQNKEDYQYNEVPNTELRKLLSRFSYNSEGRFYLDRNTLYRLDTWVYQCLISLLIYVDLVFNDGSQLC